MGLGCWGLGVGPTATLRLGAWGAGGRRGWADGDDVRTGLAVRRGARRQLCEVRQHRGRRLRGVCVARVFHVKHDVYRVAGGRATSSSIFSA